MSIISNLLNNQENLINKVKKEIKETYLQDDKPWVIGYSGGKDSTVVVQLVFDALSELEKHLLSKKVYIISSDTLVETPLIINSIDMTLSRIEKKSRQEKLPFETHKVKPQINQSFWTNIIGKGYPSPNQQFRWCTDRLKIDPANQFIKDKVDSFGEVIMLLGVREEESATRASVIESHSIQGNVLMKHSTLPNAYVYAPIKKFRLDDVWNYLLNNDSPWGDDNNELYRLYSESNSGECPLVIDKTIKKNAGSCGNSRFGCWTCTVVSEDKALTGFINNGHDWMKPLLAFRNWLTLIRDDRSMRMKYRMNGAVYFLPVEIISKNDKKFMVIHKKGARKREMIDLEENCFDIIYKEELNDYLKKNDIDLSTSDDPNVLIKDKEGNHFRLGLGPFTIEARKEILTRLLKLQKNLRHPYDESYRLIQEDELIEIRKIWFNDGDFEDSLPVIFHKIYGYELDWETNNNLTFTNDELSQLEKICREENLDFNLMKKLLLIEKQYSSFKVKRGINNELSSVLNQDYLHL